MVDSHMDIEMKSEEREHCAPKSKLSAGRRGGVLIPDSTLESFMVKKTLIQLDLKRKMSTSASDEGSDAEDSPMNTDSDFSEGEDLTIAQ